MSINMSGNFFKLLLYFREQNLDEFYDEHVRLHAEAQVSANYVPCTAHYYKLMSKIIDNFFGGNFHFVAPLDDEDECTNDEAIECKALATQPFNARLEMIALEESLRRLHKRIGILLKLAPGKRCIDIGCGIGGVMLNLATTGAQITGLTVAPGDVEMGNEILRNRGYALTCRIIESACERCIPLESGSQQAAYAIYALKYFPHLEPVLRETVRVLEQGGYFAVYDLVKTELYDESNPEHKKLLKDFEFGCGMPALHTRAEIIDKAALVSLRLVCSIDIDEESGHPFYYCFSHSFLYMWLTRSKLVKTAIDALEWLNVLPRGFARFNRVFLSGTVERIVRAGEMGIMHGGEILLFQKD